MRGETSIHTWKNALVELKERVVQDGMGDDEVFKVLKYSFDRLNRNRQCQTNEFNTLQLCFLYCSLYPEDYRINREDLVRKLISEGLVDDRKSMRAQVDQGHSILDKLENVCLLEGCVDHNNDESVKMHDLVRGMALKITEGKYMVRSGYWQVMEFLDGKECTESLEKVSLISNLGIIGDGKSPNCPNLSTFRVRRYLRVEEAIIPDSFFSKMQRLCTLDLCGTMIRMLPCSISDMKSLKALLLEKCYMLEKVPYLGKLTALKELNLSYTGIQKVPRGLDECVNLKFLLMDAHHLKMLPRGLLLKLRHLQCVNLPVYIQVPIEELENLNRLEEFTGSVKDVNDFNCFIRSRLHDIGYRVRVGSADSTHNTAGGGFGYHNKEVVLSECNLKNERVLGQDIEYLAISKCEGLSISLQDDLSVFNNPTSLKRLRISTCGGIEFIWRSEQGLAASQIPSLEGIELVELDDLKAVIQKGELGASAAPAHHLFSSLRWLTVKNFNKLKKVRLPVQGVPNLEYITISWCSEIEEIFEDEERASSALPKLKEFRIYNLPRLKRACKGAIICNSITQIWITECPRLMKKLPLHFDVTPPPTLQGINVEREWWESLEWDDPDLPKLLQPLLRDS